MSPDTARLPAQALVDSPGWYLTGEDNFRLTTFGALPGAIVTVESRLVTPQGTVVPSVDTQTPNSDRSSKTSIVLLAEGLLVSAQVRVTTGAALRGHVFAILELVRGTGSNAQPLATLIQGYLTTNGRRAWPGSALEASTDGLGRLRTIVGTNPAINTEISETVPVGARWRLRTFTYTFVASAAAANRLPILTIDDGANILWEVGSNVAQTANQTVKYRAGVGVPLTTFNALAYLLPLPSDLWLPAGARIRTVTAALDANDDYGAPIYAVEEFLEP